MKKWCFWLLAILVALTSTGCTLTGSIGGTDIVSVGIENSKQKQQDLQSAQLPYAHYPPPYYVPYY